MMTDDEHTEEVVLDEVREDEFARRKGGSRREAYSQDEEEQNGRPHGVQCASQ